MTSTEGTDDLQVAWGTRLRELREDQELTQYRLAQLAEVDTRHLDRIERGLTNASDRVRMRLAGALDVRVEDIWSYPRAEAEEATA